MHPNRLARDSQQQLEFRQQEMDELLRRHLHLCTVARFQCDTQRELQDAHVEDASHKFRWSEETHLSLLHPYELDRWQEQNQIAILTLHSTRSAKRGGPHRTTQALGGPPLLWRYLRRKGGGSGKTRK